MFWPLAISSSKFSFISLLSLSEMVAVLTFHRACDGAFCISEGPVTSTQGESRGRSLGFPSYREAQRGSEMCLCHTARKVGRWVQNPVSNSWWVRCKSNKILCRWISWQVISKQLIGRARVVLIHSPHIDGHYAPSTVGPAITGGTGDKIMNKIDIFLISEGYSLMGW